MIRLKRYYTSNHKPMDNLETGVQKKELLSEELKAKFNPLLTWYFAERVDPKQKNANKEAFLAAFNTLSPEEKRAYRDYVYQVIKNEIQSDDERLNATVDLLTNMDKLEVYAGICNACKLDLYNPNDFKNLHEKNIPEDIHVYKEPTFSVNNAKVTRNGNTIDFGNLYTEHMWNGQYKLFLDDLGFSEEQFFVIGRNENGGIVIYGKDGHKEFESKKFQKKVIFTSAHLGTKTELSLDTIK